MKLYQILLANIILISLSSFLNENVFYDLRKRREENEEINVVYSQKENVYALHNDCLKLEHTLCGTRQIKKLSQKLKCIIPVVQT